jgi:hypothetical protein
MKKHKCQGEIGYTPARWAGVYPISPIIHGLSCTEPQCMHEESA